MTAESFVAQPAKTWTPDTPPITREDLREAARRTVRAQEIRDREHAADMALVFENWPGE